MYRDVCGLAETGFQQPFGLRGEVVGLAQGDVAIHPRVEVYRYGVADAACAQIMDVMDSIHGQYSVENLTFGGFRQRTFKQLAHTRLHDVIPCLDDEEAHKDCREGVEHPPVFPQKHRSGDADQCAKRGEGVAAVMPGVGNHRR